MAINQITLCVCVLAEDISSIYNQDHITSQHITPGRLRQQIYFCFIIPSDFTTTTIITAITTKTSRSTNTTTYHRGHNHRDHHHYHHPWHHCRLTATMFGVWRWTMHLTSGLAWWSAECKRKPACRWKKIKQNVKMEKDHKMKSGLKLKNIRQTLHCQLMGFQLGTPYFIKLLFFCLLSWPSSPI